jgi:hypothetical protein
MNSVVHRKRWLKVATFGLCLLALVFSTLFGAALWLGSCGDAPGRPICPFLEHGGGAPLLIFSPAAAVLIGGLFAVRMVRIVPLLGGLFIALGIYSAYLLA